MPRTTGKPRVLRDIRLLQIYRNLNRQDRESEKVHDIPIEDWERRNQRTSYSHSLSVSPVTARVEYLS